MSNSYNHENSDLHHKVWLLVLVQVFSSDKHYKFYIYPYIFILAAYLVSLGNTAMSS